MEVYSSTFSNIYETLVLFNYPPKKSEGYSFDVVHPFHNPSLGDIIRQMCLVEISYGDLWWGTKACYTPTKLEGYSFGPYLSTLKFDAL